MIETFTRMIDGCNYSVTQLPARRALKLKAKLFKTFGTALAPVMDLSAKSLVVAIESFSKTIDENQFENLILELLMTARKDGIELTPAIIDLEFAGDMAGIYKVCAFVLEVNYENFFTMMGIGNLFPEPIAQPAWTTETIRDYTRK